MSSVIFSGAGNITTRISNSDWILFNQQDILLIQAYIPGITLTPKTSPPDILIRHIESEAQEMHIEGDTITLQDSWKNRIPLDVYHLLYSVTRKKLLEQNLYSVHAACVTGHKNYLLVGHSGTGKTTITLDLLQKGMQLFSGNKTIISLEDRITAIAGTQTITTEEKSQIPQGSDVVTYNGRYAFQLPKEKRTEQKNISLDGIILLRLNDGVREKRQLQPMSALHTLYPYFLDTVNADTIVHGTVYSGDVSEETKNHLAQSLLRQLQTTSTYRITGSKEYIIEEIQKL